MIKHCCYLICLLHYVSCTYAPSWILRLNSYERVDIIARDNGLINKGQIGELIDMYNFVYADGKDKPYPNITSSLKKYAEVIYVEQEQISNHVLRDYQLPTDPYWHYQWPWFNIGQSSGTVGDDINIVPVWIQGITGCNTAALVIDNGIQLDHPDLINNIDLSICYSSITKSTDINPLISLEDYGHGTSCAGEIAMIHDNGVCGVGVAYNARIGGYQVNFNRFLPNDEARAFTFHYQDIQAYSNSWGPNDNGYTVAGPPLATKEAFNQGTAKGRNGLGSIYVFSSGNGGHNDDSCAADGYVNSIYTIAVGSADQSGYQAYYDESCSAKMAVTYTYNSVSSGQQVTTTFPQSQCVRNYTGTSASAPLVVGVILLALEVNPYLSWRDVQYLIAYTSKTSMLHGDFNTNGVGLKFNNQFGFGAIDAEALVNRARHWTPVGPAKNLTVSILDRLSQSFSVIVSQSHPYTTTFTVHKEQKLYLEHVTLTVSFGIITSSSICSNPLADCAKRGDASIVLCSPHGTCSTLLPKRLKDYISDTGYDYWPFMSVHFWGEDANGEWNVTMRFDSNSASLTYISAQLYYTSDKPVAAGNKCDPLCATPTGCSYGNGSQYCDACRDGYYRNVTTLECVSSCPSDACTIEDICVFYNGTCPTISNGLSKLDIIIIVLICFITVIIVLLLSVICCCCCCCKSKKIYVPLHSDFIEETSYQPYSDIKPTVV